MLSKKENSKLLFKNNINIYKCPLCSESLSLANDSLKCLNNHTFNINKKGVINFTTPMSDKLYNEELFKSRRNVLKSNIFTKIKDTLLDLIDDNNLFVLDVGCGEGSYLNYLKDKASNYYVGLDLSKPALNLASDYLNSNFLLADLANIPIHNNSVDVILNILSPANYEEFNRILKSCGYLIKVIVNNDYLIELREDSKDNDSNVLNVLMKHMIVVDEFDIKYSALVSEEIISDLNKMTPINFHSDKIKLIDEITIDFKIIIAKKL